MMLKHIRSIIQEEAPGRHREMTLFRSDNYLYVMSVVGSADSGVWTGEMGLCSKETLVETFKTLRAAQSMSPMKPTILVVAISHGAHVSRIGHNGELKKELDTDVEGVTFFFHGHHLLAEFLTDLEGALSWAA